MFRASKRKSFSLLEVIIALVILSIALFGLISVILSTFILNKEMQEIMLANKAIQMKLEELKATDFRTLYALYHRKGSSVEGLKPVAPGTEVIFVHFYVNEEGFDDGHPLNPEPLNAETREKLGFPHPPVEDQGIDLNGNGIISGSASSNYIILPTRIRVRWQSTSRIRMLDFYCMLNHF